MPTGGSSGLHEGQPRFLVLRKKIINHEQLSRAQPVCLLKRGKGGAGAVRQRHLVEKPCTQWQPLQLPENNDRRLGGRGKAGQLHQEKTQQAVHMVGLSTNRHFGIPGIQSHRGGPNRRLPKVWIRGNELNVGH
ncbi:hypothetical protein GCM10017707_29750 [Paenarthrobacter aurescens]